MVRADNDPQGLVDRGALLDELMNAAEHPSGRDPIVLHGEPGIGKTALLDEVAQRTMRSDTVVLRAVGAEAERSLPYATLHELVAPVAPLVEALPPVLRSALRAAFGLEVGEPSPEATFHVALALLHVVTHATPTRAVLLIDDAQWVDRDTLAALALVARRTRNRAVLVVLAARPGAELPFGDLATEVVVPALSEPAARALLEQRWPIADRLQRDRVVAAAAGNPLALLELPETVRDVADFLALTSPFASAVPLSARLERAFARYYHVLPATTSTVLLAAALNSGPSAMEALTAAGSVLGRVLDIDELHPAIDLELVALTGDRLSFRHPLLRSGLIQDAPDSDRRRTHRALAEVHRNHPDRRAWHRAQTVIVDENIAVELEEAAGRADVRGAPETALILLEQAVAVTPEPRARQVRASRVAELAIELGRNELAQRILTELEDDLVPWAAALRIYFDQRPRHADDAAHDEPAETTLNRILRAVEAGRSDLALRALEVLAKYSRAELAAGALVAARRLLDTTPAPLGLQIVAHEPTLAGFALKIMRRELSRSDLDAATRRIHATTATVGFDFATAADVLPAIASDLLHEGRRALAGQALVSLGCSHLFLGRLVEAESAIQRAVGLFRETQQVSWLPGILLIQAWSAGLARGGDVARAGVEAVWAEMPDSALRPLHQAFALGAHAAAAAAESRWADAADHGRELFAAGNWVRWVGIADYVEAAVRAERDAEVRPLVAELRDLVRLYSSQYLRDTLTFCEAVLTVDPREADTAFARLLDVDPPRNPLLWARAALADGVRLRRLRRIREARMRLEQAQQYLRSAGPTLWDGKVLQELRATRALPRARHADDGLTPQEREVALLVTRGMSNREVGAKLLISPRTVSTHLHRVFRKLRVTDRRDLADALPPREG